MISAVTITYHTGPILIDCLKNLSDNKYISEIVLLNNGNPEGFIETVPEKVNSEKLKIISGHGNIGFSKGCNLGAKHATGDYILIVNPDCIVRPDFDFKALLDALDDPKIMMSTCRIFNKDGTEQRGSRRNILNPYNVFYGFNLNKSPIPTDPFYVEATSGAFMLFKKEDYNMLGGFDENYYLHVEDMDLCMKIKQIGGKIKYFPKVTIMHALSTSDAPKKFIEQHKLNGLIYYYNKYFGNNLLTPIVLFLLKIRFYLRFSIK
ncbi:MAG: glycosyltransferase family 2 protein [Sphingobacteriia bacterium]|nr:glycosyltransferase family 2 protein [Sphingobacteriia bacterium]